MSDDDAWLAPLRAKFAARLARELDELPGIMSDRDSVIDRAHKLAGIAGTLGEPRIGEAALALEDMARTDRNYDTEFRGLIAALKAALA